MKAITHGVQHVTTVIISPSPCYAAVDVAATARSPWSVQRRVLSDPRYRGCRDGACSPPYQLPLHRRQGYSSSSPAIASHRCGCTVAVLGAGAWPHGKWVPPALLPPSPMIWPPVRDFADASSAALCSPMTAPLMLPPCWRLVNEALSRELSLGVVAEASVLWAAISMNAGCAMSG